MRTAAAILTIACSIVSYGAGAQTANGKALGPAPAEDVQRTEDSTPRLDLQFRAGDPIPGMTASPAMVMPLRCSVDGALLVDMLEPPDFKSRVIYLTSRTKSTAISLKSIPDYPAGAFLIPSHGGLQIIDVFAGHSHVAVLLTAPKVQDGAAKTNDWHQFIARFDLDGTFQDTIELPISYQLFRLAMLPSGEFLAFGFDNVNGVPRLLLLDSDGQPKGTLQLPQNMEAEVQSKAKSTNNAALPQTASDAFLASEVFGNVYFSTYGEKVILWRPGKNSIIEIGGEGATREVQVESPKGYQVEEFIPSNDRWIIQYVRTSLPGSAAIDPRPELRDYVLYEVSPRDGGLRLRLDVGSAPHFWMACEHDGVLTTYKTDDKQHLIPVTADLSK
jgi:hypothetical protein